MRQRVICILLFFVALPIGVAPAQTDSTGKRPAKTLDEKLLIDINHYGIHHAWLDQPMKGLSNSLAFTSIGVPTALYLYGMTSNDRDEAVAGASIAISEVVSGLLDQGLKVLIRRDRPYITLQDVRLPGTPAGGFSMPSGHATAAWTLATSLALHYPKTSVIYPAMLYALGVSISRPYLGVHYPSDILAGAMLGAGIAYLTYHYENEIMSKFSWALPTPGGTTQGLIVAPFFAPLGVSLTLPLFEP